MEQGFLNVTQFSNHTSGTVCGAAQYSPWAQPALQMDLEVETGPGFGARTGDSFVANNGGPSA